MRESERKLANTWRGIFLLRSHCAHSIIAAVGDGTGGLMKSSIVKHSIVINGHKTSVSLENAFWSDLKEIAHAQEATLSELVAKIDQARQRGNLSSAIRLFVLEHIRLVSGTAKAGAVAIAPQPLSGG